MKGAESHLNLVQIYENFLQKVVSGWAQYNSNILHASLWEDRSWKKSRGIWHSLYCCCGNKKYNGQPMIKYFSSAIYTKSWSRMIGQSNWFVNCNKALQGTKYVR